MADATPAIEPVSELQQKLNEIESLGTEGTKNLSFWSRPDWENTFESIEITASTYVNKLIDTSVVEDDASAAKPKISVVIDIIKSRRASLALSSSTTEQIVGICKQILAFGVAGLALSVGFSDKIHTLSSLAQRLIVLAGIFYLELVLISLIVLIWYLLQSHFRYPFLYFKKIGNAWPYFYYSSISRSVNRSPIQNAESRVKAGVSYARDFVTFSDLCLKETPKDRLRAELQQYFLLISYQGYVQQFALRLANLFFYGFVGAVFSTALICLWSLTR